ncbi:MAG: cofactor-independent phosphoglycerate mutase [Prevotella sp.]|nr:cofactor-independent phosphoglycerate mutase [Prevotella sp.]
MKTIIILGDGMADNPVEKLGGKTPLQYAKTPYMDLLAKQGRTGRLVTVPEGYMPGSEVANTAILGYDLDKVYEGRGPLEAASIGYEMAADDLALRCNIICVREDGTIKTHNGGNLTTEDAGPLIDLLNEQLGSDRVKWVKGIQYRHLLIIKGGSKHVVCTPPHDHPDEQWRPLLVKPEEGMADFKEDGRMTPQETADLLNDLILRSVDVLAKAPLNIERKKHGADLANIIWPWSGGYRPAMQTLMEQYPQVKSGAVVSAVDLIRGIGHYAGLDIVEVEGATGLWDTNYEGKTRAALNNLREKDFVFLHVEASDEAGHDGDVDLKVKTIENLDSRMIGPIYEEVKTWDEPVQIAILPDHYTPVEMRIHVGEPVPFIIYYPGIEADDVQSYDEYTCVGGGYGILKLQEFMQCLMHNS